MDKEENILEENVEEIEQVADDIEADISEEKMVPEEADETEETGITEEADETEETDITEEIDDSEAAEAPEEAADTEEAEYTEEADITEEGDEAGVTAEAEPEENAEEIPETEDELPEAENEKKELEIPPIEMLEKELSKERYRNNYGQVLKSTIFYLLVVAAVAVIIAVFILPVLQISGTSMTDTLDDRDIVVAVSSKKYETGDVVAFYFNNNILIKRVIAKAGDWVDLDEEGNVYVNGELLDEPYVTDKALGDCNIKLPYQVPDGKFFIMGDHRATSVDSRNAGVGCISDEMMVGRLLFRVWPLNKMKVVK